MPKIAERKRHLWNEIELIDKVHDIIEAYNTVMYENEKDDYILFVAAYPDWVFDLTGESTPRRTKIICYDITKKDSGSLGPNQFDRSKRIRPVEMGSSGVVINEGENDEKTVVRTELAKPYDIIYRFDCMAPTDRGSMELVRTFERMLEIHGKYLETGCKRFIYNGRRPSYFNRDTRYKSRTCEFFAQVEEHWFTIDDRIEEINVKYLDIPALLVLGERPSGVVGME